MAAMPRWLIIAICAVVALVVCWICIHPGVDLAPTVFRFAAFVAAVMLWIRTPKPIAGGHLPRRTIFRIESAFGLVFAPLRGSSATAPLRC
jgi:hypothetical protein